MKFFALCLMVVLLTSCGKDVGVIGGADGPTSMFITEKSSEDIVTVNLDI